ncbi:MAG TPA: hypothetical protein HA252_02940 [Candidatus Diapherotrites archaeon]|uniref:MBL fold metallo-hydrolase n=1 Tax=Candidatus Iainarchaeum sp. TaxID=3101447 RepID=A0A7J4JJ07_9ARCH|nr:MBL fold metallo-hydrolase [Candidatus Diapherotrites archaeon]HIH16335.1 hypothetical protein [Candidatus Diapherotrites archaeon]
MRPLSGGVEGFALKVQFLGHSSFLLSFNGAGNAFNGVGNVLIDPYFHNQTDDPAFKRIINAPVKKEDLKKVDLLLVTQEGFDHFDKKAVEFFANRDNCLVVGHDSVLNELHCNDALHRPIAMNQKLRLKGFEIEAKEAHYPQSFYPLAYLIRSNGSSVFHAGDTSLLDTYNEVKADVALLPIGGNLTMDLIDAVKATKTIKPKYAIPMHYNTFDMIQADPAEFKARIEKSVVHSKPVIMKPGQTVKV